MLAALQVLAILLVSLVLAPSLAHAAELPGKMRLGQAEYRAVQTIYSPGFTRLGIAEPLAILVLLVATVATPYGGAAFWLTFGAFLATLTAHTLYWLLTHPVNSVWLKDVRLGRADTAFFAARSLDAGDHDADWTRLRDRWERSHVARAACAGLALVMISIAAAL